MELDSLKSFNEFIEEYRGRLLRINDRENHMFMQA